MDTFMRSITEATGLKRYNDAIIYSEDVLELEEDDIGYIKDGDTIYFEPEGKKFDSAQIIDQYEKLSLLGKGGFGLVYKVKHKKTDEIFAMKYIDFTENLKSAKMISEIYKESKTLKSLKHKNIIKLYTTFLHKSDLILIMEVCEGGELKALVKEKGGLDELYARDIIR